MKGIVMYNAGYPAANFTWDDRSGASTEVLFSTVTDGLCVPFGFTLAERGTPGEIYFGAAAELNKALGSETFREASKFFTPATRFIATAMGGQGVEVMRLVDPDATVARMGLFLHLNIGMVTQYQKTVTGAYILDTNGNPQPILDGSNNPVQEQGVILRWVARALEEESFDDLQIQNTGFGTAYPILGFEVSSPGSYGNRQGFSLYSTGSELAAVATDVNSVLYRFAPYELPTAVSTTASAIPDVFGSKFVDISFKDQAIYSRTSTNYAAEFVFGSNYVNADNGDSLLPYNIKVYGENIAEIGELVLQLSPELGDIDPYMIDLISGRMSTGEYYDHVQIDSDSSEVTNSAVVNYASDGTDGEVSFEKLQELIVDWLEGSDHGEFPNVQQHPMTHFTDPGFTMTTKLALLNMLDLRDNFKIDLATQDVLLPLNTKAQDLSAAQTLSFAAQAHPESVINGVGCTRVGVYAHAGKLVVGSAFAGNIPFTMNRLVQRREYDGGTYITGSAGGLPNSEVTLFRKANWTADEEGVRKLAWAQSVNVVMHASRTVMFYPDIRTVYPNDTSLLSSDEVSDRIIYMMKICRGIWARYSGVRRPAEKLFPLIERDIDNEINTAMNGDNIQVVSTVLQTAVDANLGYATSVNLAISGNPALRQMNFNVIVGRSSE
jgi:hypothetical protein